MKSIISPLQLIPTLVIGCVSLIATTYAQPEASFDPFQIGGVQQPELSTEYASAKDWVTVYKKNALISIDKEAISFYANVPVSSIIAQTREMLTVAGFAAIGLAGFIRHFPADYRRLTGEVDRGWRFILLQCSAYAILPTLWLGLILLRLPEWQKNITSIQELWNLATQKAPLLSFRPQGIILGNKTKIRWSEIGSVIKVQRQAVQPDSTTETTLHLAINNPEGTCIAEVPGILLPTTIDAILELVGYYQKKSIA